MKDFDYGKKPLYLLCTVLVLVGIGFIWRWLRVERFYPPEEHWDIDGPSYSGGWTTLAQGIAFMALGFVLLFMFG